MKAKLLRRIRYVSLLIYMLVLALPGADAQQIVQIGKDTTSNNTYNPIAYGGTYGKNTHWQILYTVEDFKAQGFSGPAILDSVAFNITDPNIYPLPGFGIKVKNTVKDIIQTFDSIGLKQAHYAASYTTTLGWNWYTFQTPFVWDGISNLLIDVCFDSIPAATTARVGRLQYDGKTTGKIVYRSVTGKCGDYSSSSTHVNRPNMQFSLRKLADCTGKPSAPGLLPAGPFNTCASADVTLTASITSFAAGTTYLWEYSVDNGNTWLKLDSVKGSSATFNPVTNTQYRVSLNCGSQSTASNVVTVNVSNKGLIYRPVPYSQLFEEWQNRCDSLELPDVNWAAFPATGNQSWRREDQGASAKWTGTVVPSFYPVKAGDHSARFHTCSNVGEGSLSMYLDCSTKQGGKELRFDHINLTGGSPRMDVMLSKDGGNTFIALQTLNSQGVNGSWQPQVIPFESNSNKTVIRFRSTSYSQSGDYDMGINNLYVLEPCTEQPVAGIVDSVSICSGNGMKLSLTGTTFSAGLEWLWQESTDGIGWADVTNGNVEHPSVSITQSTWYRCIVTCSNSGLKDTSAPRLLTIKPFYSCYCTSGPTGTTMSINIGNVKIRPENDTTLLLDNGNPLPSVANPEAKKKYSNFTDLPPVNLFRDSSYKIDLTFFTGNGTNVRPQMGGAYTAIFIDFNRNGEYESNEMIWGHTKKSDVFNDSALFKVPNSAEIGITGMRIVTSTTTYDTTLTKACGSFSNGETEDYLVRIHDIPCKGTEETGVLTALDTSFCPGYPFALSHINADSTAGLIVRSWETSADGRTWAGIANSTDQSSLRFIFDAPGYYRVKAECKQNKVLSYTDSVYIGQETLCYCASYATGDFAGTADSSDIGSFKMLTIDIPLNGGHLNNPDADSRYTNYKHLPAMEMYIDSSYSFVLDHILLRDKHADAKITMFIDYNGNGSFDIPEERVYTGISEATTWHKTGSITIPSHAVLEKETGLRLIINNDVSENIPSDEACGTYVSGETEDYRVVFKKGDEKEPISTGSLVKVKNTIKVYPNPANSTVSILYKGSYSGKASLSIQNIAGQTLERNNYENIADGSILTLDLNYYSKGLYFIKVECATYTETVKLVLQ